MEYFNKELHYKVKANGKSKVFIVMGNEYHSSLSNNTVIKCYPATGENNTVFSLDKFEVILNDELSLSKA